MEKTLKNKIWYFCWAVWVTQKTPCIERYIKQWDIEMTIWVGVEIVMSTKFDDFLNEQLNDVEIRSEYEAL